MRKGMAMATNAQISPQYLRVGDLARRTGKSVRAIHLYEELGLLEPATRSSGGFRLYHDAAVDRAVEIHVDGGHDPGQRDP